MWKGHSIATDIPAGENAASGRRPGDCGSDPGMDASSALFPVWFCRYERIFDLQKEVYVHISGHNSGVRARIDWIPRSESAPQLDYFIHVPTDCLLDPASRLECDDIATQ